MIGADVIYAHGWDCDIAIKISLRHKSYLVRLKLMRIALTGKLGFSKSCQRLVSRRHYLYTWVATFHYRFITVVHCFLGE